MRILKVASPAALPHSSKYQAISVRLATSLQAEVANQTSPLSSKVLFVS